MTGDVVCFGDVTTQNVRDNESSETRLHQSAGATGVAMAESKVLRVRRDDRRKMSESVLNLAGCSVLAVSLWSQWLRRHWHRRRNNRRSAVRKVKRGCVRYAGKWIPLRTYVCVQVSEIHLLFIFCCG